MEKQKITGKITSKEYQKKSNNYKLKISTTEQRKYFFYSQQKHQAEIEKLETGLTETEKKERQILDSIVVNWFYKAI